MLSGSPKSKKRYFVRTSSDEAAAKAAFGDIEFVKAEGVSGEIGFLTGEMSEADYESRAKALDIIQMIRA